MSTVLSIFFRQKKPSTKKVAYVFLSSLRAVSKKLTACSLSYAVPIDSPSIQGSLAPIHPSPLTHSQSASQWAPARSLSETHWSG